MALPQKKLCEYELPLGVNLATGNPLALNAEWLRTGLHVIGPTGCGKTRFLLNLFNQLTKINNATIFVLSPAKPDVYHMTRDAAIAGGLTSRLILFDIGDPEVTIGYNTLKPNGQPITTQAKFAKESFRSAWGQGSFDQTPQLKRAGYVQDHEQDAGQLRGLVEGALRPGAAEGLARELDLGGDGLAVGF